jgi:plastocyanin
METLTTRTRSRAPLVLVIAVLVALAAIVVVGTQVDDPGRPDADGLVEVTMDHYRFQPDELFLPAETPVTLSFTNVGNNVHTVALGREVIEEDAQQFGFREDLIGDLSPTLVPQRTRVGPAGPGEPFTFYVDPGETVQVSVTIPRDRVGEWEMGCFNACGAHYRAGLAGTVHVEAPE